MNKSSKIIAIIFILIIFLFGATTVLKCKDVFIGAVQSREVFAKSESIDEALSQNFKVKTAWININGLFQRMMGATVVRDPGGKDVYKLANGQIMYNNNERDVETYAAKLKGLSEYTEKNGIDFIYVQLPFKIESDDVMPPGTTTYAQKNMDTFLSAIDKTGVPYIDIREKMAEINYSYEEMFFKTDHHWKPDAGLWAADVILSELEKTEGYAYEETLLDYDNYSVKTYENWFLGSLGKRTGFLYSGLDDFDVITPKFETEFDFYAESSNGPIERYGSFENALLRQSEFEERNFFGGNTYAGYTGGDYKLNIVENLKTDSETDVLLIRDSFSCVLMPYLAVGTKSVTTIDMRHYEEMSVAEYIDKNDFDIVIVAYNPTSFNDIQFDFFKQQ